MRLTKSALVGASLLLASFGCGKNETKTAQARPCAGTLASDASGNPTARVFSLGIRQDLRRMTSYDAYSAIFEEAMAEQAPCFSKTLPNLVVLPEDSALMAAFIGARGEEARAYDDSLSAFATLFSTYADPLSWYRKAYPSAPGVRQLLLAMTDTLARAIEQTFPRLAKKYGVYLVTNVNVAPYESTDDPELVARLGDPDAGDGKSAWVATEPEVYNVAIAYDPEGREIGRVRKAYLVPAEEDMLMMSYGPLEQLRPIATPIGRLAPVISKDAWMPDVLERFNDLGADITLQHEAFSGWGIAERDGGEWLPEVVMESMWNHVQAYDSFRFSLFPCLTGNLLDMVFDCQSAVVLEASPGQPAQAFVGMEPVTGFLDIGPWVMPDPVEEDATLSLEERRNLLRERGQAMTPGAGEPYENAYTQSSARGDIALLRSESGLSRRTAEGGETIELVESVDDEVNQIRPDAAVSGGTLHVIWLNDTPENRTVRHARRKGTDSFSVRDLPFAAEKPYAARITADGERVYVVAVDDAADGASSRLLLARSTDGGATWTVDGDALNDGPASARWNPAVAAADGRFYVTWTDRRSGSSDIYLAASDDAGETFTTRRLDTPHENEKVAGNARNPRNNQALSALAVSRSTIVATWADFRDYAWDIYATFSTDGGDTFSPNVRINPPAAIVDEKETERIYGINSVAILGTRALIAYEGLDDRGPWRRVETTLLCLSDCEGTTATGFEEPEPSYRPHLAIDGNSVVAVWQDLRNGDNDVYAATWNGVNWSSVVKAAGGPGQQFNPRSAGRTIVWEDWRSGHARVGVNTVAD